MGNNAAFTQFEETVIATYNKGGLDKELLSTFMEMHRGRDIDRGGMAGTLAHDGLDIDGIILKTFGVEAPERPDLPADYKTWTDAQRAANDDYNDRLDDLISEIENRFGWC